MSFLLDPFALLSAGFVVGKAYYLIFAFGDRLLRRGSLKKELVVVGAAIVGSLFLYNSLLYSGELSFPWPLPRWFGGTDWMLNSGLPLGLARSTTTDVFAVLFSSLYPAWFYAGTRIGLSGHRLSRGQLTSERGRILRALVATSFPEGGAIPPGAAEVGTAAVVESLFARIPPLFCDALTVLLFVFDSRFFVLAFTGRFTRFVDLGREEERSYLEAWNSNRYLSSAAQILRITASYGYYTRPQVYKLLDYQGPMVPDLPPWYNHVPPLAGVGLLR